MRFLGIQNEQDRRSAEAFKSVIEAAREQARACIDITPDVPASTVALLIGALLIETRLIGLAPGDVIRLVALSATGPMPAVERDETDPKSVIEERQS